MGLTLAFEPSRTYCPSGFGRTVTDKEDGPVRRPVGSKKITSSERDAGIIAAC